MERAPVSTITEEITSFLASSPSAEQIIAYELPESLQERALELLKRSRQNVLSPDERMEMDEFLRINHFMNMLKIKTRLNLAEKS